MVRRAGILVVGALLAGCGGGAAAPPAATPARDPAAQLFVRSGCGACHTLRAAGTHGSNGPDLDTSERLTRAQIRTALTEGANGMPDYSGQLTAAQLDALAGFLYEATHPGAAR